MSCGFTASIRFSLIWSTLHQITLSYFFLGFSGQKTNKQKPTKTIEENVFTLQRIQCLRKVWSFCVFLFSLYTDQICWTNCSDEAVWRTDTALNTLRFFVKALRTNPQTPFWSNFQVEGNTLKEPFPGSSFISSVFRRQLETLHWP